MSGTSIIAQIFTSLTYLLRDGTEYGTYHENETLFLKIQAFLAKSGRFNPQS